MSKPHSKTKYFPFSKPYFTIQTSLENWLESIHELKTLPYLVRFFYSSMRTAVTLWEHSTNMTVNGNGNLNNTNTF